MAELRRTECQAMQKSTIALDDQYEFNDRPFYLNGTQSLVRLTLLELRRRNHCDAVKIAELPQSIRGFGHIKERSRRVCHDASGRAPRTLFAM